MNKVYQEIADSFEKLSKCYSELAKEESKNNILESKSENKNSSVKEEVTIEKIREVLSKKSLEGKTEEVKALLMKFGVEKLSNVKTEDYKSLFANALKI